MPERQFRPSYEKLFKRGRYEAMLVKYVDEAHSGKTSQYAGFYVSDALFTLALKQSKNPPLPGPAPGVIAEEKDIIEFNLARALAETGPNIWSPSVSKKYGEANICILKQLFVTSPTIFDYQKRYLATFISMGRFSEAVREAEKLQLRSIDAYELAQVTEVFIGFREPIHAAKFIVVLRDKHGLSPDAVAYWTQLIHRYVDWQYSDPNKRKALHARVMTVLGG